MAVFSVCYGFIRIGENDNMILRTDSINSLTRCAQPQQQQNTLGKKQNRSMRYNFIASLFTYRN